MKKDLKCARSCIFCIWPTYATPRGWGWYCPCTWLPCCGDHNYKFWWISAQPSMRRQCEGETWKLPPSTFGGRRKDGKFHIWQTQSLTLNTLTQDVQKRLSQQSCSKVVCTMINHKSFSKSTCPNQNGFHNLHVGTFSGQTPDFQAVLQHLPNNKGLRVQPQQQQQTS